jgi:hypothetical protein
LPPVVAELPEEAVEVVEGEVEAVVAIHLQMALVPDRARGLAMGLQ